MTEEEATQVTERIYALIERIQTHKRAYESIGEEVPNFRISKSEAKDIQADIGINALPQIFYGCVLEYASSDFATTYSPEFARVMTEISRWDIE